MHTHHPTPLVVLCTLCALGGAAPIAAQAANPVVPLELWTTPTFPNGIEFGKALGVSCGDWDGDGWVDLYVNVSGNLWHNEQGNDWTLAGNLNGGAIRQAYGASFGDANGDGLPELATEPRTRACFRFLVNLGGGRFVDVTGSPTLIPNAPCGEASETACWADVDFDGRLDLFLPTYPPAVGGGTQGNYFWHNLGPLWPGGPASFEEISVAAGLAVPPEHARPEGAQFCDYDGDGDLDLYADGTLYQNVSAPGAPAFVPLTGAVGFTMPQLLDEGAAFCDFDLDGDFDLIVSYTDAPGVVVWDNRGDGTFVLADVVQDPLLAKDLGISIADWDGDGDPDLTSRWLFRANTLLETGRRGFAVVSNTIPASHIESPTIAWADFDRDGDLDAAIGNLGLLGTDTGHFYRNTTYDASTPPSSKRHLRVLPVRRQGGIDLQTEYGAIGRVLVKGAPRVLMQQVASSHGYLNQNEYALHFFVPATFGTEPSDPHAEVRVTFPADPASGPWQVDPVVQPLLGDVPVVALQDRELVVDRSGSLHIDGVDVPANPYVSPQLFVTGGGLPLPAPGTTASAPSAVEPGTWAGVALRTGAQAEEVMEVVVDGVLDDTPPFQIGLWDLSDTQEPRLVAVQGQSSEPHNHRSTVAVDFVLRPFRDYWLLAAVKSLRSSPFAGPEVRGGLTTMGSVLVHKEPAGGAAPTAPVDGGHVHLALRFRPVQLGVGVDLGGGGAPSTASAGTLSLGGLPLPAGALTLHLSGATPDTPALALVANSARPVTTLFGRTLMLDSPQVLLATQTDANGNLTITTKWPAQPAPPGQRLFFQVLTLTPKAVIAASPVVFAESP